MRSHLVSTIIPVHNRPHLLKKAVDSVLTQTYRPIEIIIVDDGSTDETGFVADAFQSQYPEIIRVIHKENGGPGLAREAGRQIAQGEFIQYLDSDDLLLPHKFEVQVAALRANLDCGIAYGHSRLTDAHGHVLREPSKWTGQKKSRLFPALLVDRWWHTHTPLYRRALCDAIGPYEANQPEDWEYDARAGALRTKLCFCDEVVSCQVEHSGHRVTRWPHDLYLPEEAAFLPKLYACAIQAGVDTNSAEMRHFSRWAFSLSRRMAETGVDTVADQLLALAQQANPSNQGKLKIYQYMARLLGRKQMARLAAFCYRLCGGRPGAETLKQSWMSNGERIDADVQ